MMPCYDKKSARKSALDLRLALGEEKRNAIDARLCASIAKLDEFIQCDTLLLYFPTKNEPNLLPLATLALQQGKHVAFPISHTDTFTLSFKTISSLDELMLGSYNIYEPRADLPSARISHSTLCIVPALSYDTRGYRLGYGKGYYDRFLKNFEGVSAGAIFSELLCETLPIENTDIPVDILITERGVMRLK